ncbi:amino acid ABC transporter substrate-binding protein [Bradyrhizobium sp.]|uniref:amino acid ABC transporter substrate-binding protein n=1 Tax=Bradyrhizobium sp. TaxID=376 RepID=UPI002B6AE83B|nr:amino acid ABC transporter substrate-binding protein [Bradyrhizobium sp.]HMM89330.1 amino acid ABC transporter substrate-binding protein [Bradyrhizobium sp.]
MQIRQILKYATIALVGSSALAVVNAQTSSPTLKAIKERGAISVGHRESLIPFSYYDQDQKVVGYSADICREIIPAIAKAAGIDDLKIALVPVSSSNRIPLLANWTIDMECGATTNNTERQRYVSFSVTHFVTSNRFVSKKNQNLTKFDDLKGKTVVSVSGTTNIKQLTEFNLARNLGINILAVKDHAEAFLAVETDRAAAFVMDDVILAGFVSGSKDPSIYQISQEPLSLEPYGFMTRRDDPEFKAVVDEAMADLFKSPKMKEIYAKWFLQPIPPRGNTLAMPISDALSKVLVAPSDSADAVAYR